jgi:hypothetical protein
MQKYLIFIVVLFMYLFLLGCAGISNEAPVATSKPSLISNEVPVATSKPSFKIQQPKTTQIICAEEWVSCGIQAVGSLVQSSQKRALATFWKTSCACGDGCGCIDGLADGDGFARWCDTSTLCNDRDLYGSVSGKLSNGKYVAQNGKILVTINSARGLFRGEINNDGSYAAGVIEQIGSKEKFLGLLDERGYYKSGALYIDNKIIIANQFDGKKPLGRVLIGDSNGNFTEKECNDNGCQQIKEDQNNLISDLFKMLAGNKTEEIGARSALRLIGKEALLMHPAFRAFSFLSNAFDVFELAEKYTS